MVKKFFKKSSSIFSMQQTSILSAASIIMTMVAASRIMGLIRDRMLTDRFSVTDLGVYFAAFRLPNLVFELIVMGAVATAFIPVFTAHLANGKDQAFQLASSVINIGLLLFSLVAILILLFTEDIVRTITPGFNATELALLVSFTRIMLVAQVFPLIVGNFFTGMLQSYKQF
ncbi:hypothetical protein HYS11_00515, partial [Candidatus Gottesmanbacteria bacterium]|nr:hypothetical protein [Candidatus Gottesmanbacteria bacterium]